MPDCFNRIFATGAAEILQLRTQILTVLIVNVLTKVTHTNKVYNKIRSQATDKR